jgi:hypothetical protein
MPDFRRPASRLSEYAREEEEVEREARGGSDSEGSGEEGGESDRAVPVSRCRVAAAEEEDATEQPAAEEDPTE